MTSVDDTDINNMLNSRITPKTYIMSVFQIFVEKLGDACLKMIPFH